MIEPVDDAPPPSTRWTRMMALMLVVVLTTTFVVAYFVRQLHWGWIGTAVTLVYACGATGALAAIVQRRARAFGASTAASRRYNRRMLISTFAYALGLYAATWLFKEADLSRPVLWLVPLLPLGGALGMIWAMARFVGEESDEYIRTLSVRQGQFGTRFLLVVATIWGFYEQFRLVPHIPSWVALPVFAVGLLLAAASKKIHA